jgi:hypothetical protein
LRLSPQVAGLAPQTAAGFASVVPLWICLILNNEELEICLMKKLLLSACAVVALAGCATYDDDYRGAPPDDSDVIYDREGYYREGHVGDLRSPGGLDLPRETDNSQALPPPVYTSPSGNRLRSPEPAPEYPTEAVPPR